MNYYLELFKVYMNKKEVYTQQELIDLTGWNYRRVRYCLNRLLKLGKVERIYVLSDMRQAAYKKKD